MTLLYKDEVYKIVGAAMEVYNVLGNGFLEAVYQEAFEYELKLRGISFESQPEIKIRYKDKILDKTYKPDLLVFGKVIIELKALEKIGKNEEAQLLNYLSATDVEVGIIVNFGAKNDIEWKRMILTEDQKARKSKFKKIRGDS